MVFIFGDLDFRSRQIALSHGPAASLLGLRVAVAGAAARAFRKSSHSKYGRVADAASISAA